MALHWYLHTFQFNQDIIQSDSPCRAVYMIMSGVVRVYIKLKNDEELYTDVLGVGSIIGQYSMLEQEISIIGFRAMSAEGVQCAVLTTESFERLAKHND